jgi:hypothetical protein
VAAYRAQIQRGGTRPSKLESSVEATSPGGGGRVVVNAVVRPVWWATGGRGLSFKGAGHTWVFVTRDDSGWQIEKVQPYLWCGGMSRTKPAGASRSAHRSSAPDTPL